MSVIEKYQPRCRIFLLNGEKFRTNLFALFFDLPLQRETTTKTALLAEVLKRNHWQEMAVQAEELYGALWDVSVVKKGDRQLLLFSLETLKTVPAEEALNFLKKCIQRPMEEGRFEEKTVKRQKAILRRKLEGLRDNKRAFAQKRVSEETAEGTPYAVSGDGYLEDLEEIGEKSLFLYYRNMLEKAEVKIFFCGDKIEKSKVLSLRQEFPGKVSVTEQMGQEQPKNGPRFLQEHAKMKQARLLLGFSADTEYSHRQVALLLLNHLLGGSPDSLLFQKIREEQGRCYDVKSYLEPMSPYLFVQVGIDAGDARETGKQVLKAIEQLKKEVSEEKLKQAKDNILHNYDGMADSSWAMVDFFAEQALQGNPMTTEKFLRQLERVDAEDIMRAAEHLKLRVVYLLSEKEEEHGSE